MKDQITWPSNGATHGAVPAAVYRVRFLRFLRRKWWIIAATVALAVGAQVAWLMLRPAAQVYVGRMMVARKVNIPDGGLYAEDWQNFFGTQIEVMKSDKLRQRVLTRLAELGQDKHPCGVKLEVSQTRRTTIFVITATGTRADYTEAYLNAVMDEFLAYRKEVRNSSSDGTLAALTGQFLDEGKELQADRDGLLAFEKTNSLPLLQEQASSVGLARLDEQLTDLKLQRDFLATSNDTPAEADMAAAKAWEDSGLFSGHAPADLSAKQWLDMLEFQKKELGRDLRPEHPKMVKLDDEIASATNLVAIHRNQGREQREAAKAALDVKISDLEKAIQDWRMRVTDANNRLAEYANRKATVDRVQEYYTRLDHLLQGVGLDKNVDQENMVIMDRAMAVPQNPTIVKLALAPVMGLMAGVGLLLFLVMQDDRVTSFAELKQRFPEKILGHIPNVRRNGSETPPGLLTTHDDGGALVESYRSICSAILHTPRGSRPGIILVTSTRNGDGKSTVAVGVARCLAQTGTRVLVVDAARSGLLSSLLSVNGERTPEGVALTAVPNVFYAGRDAFGNGGDIFLKAGTDELLKQWSGQFDCVLVDTDPGAGFRGRHHESGAQSRRHHFRDS